MAKCPFQSSLFTECRPWCALFDKETGQCVFWDIARRMDLIVNKLDYIEEKLKKVDKLLP